MSFFRRGKSIGPGPAEGGFGFGGGEGTKKEMEDTFKKANEEEGITEPNETEEEPKE